jgi:SAM-dependent methyltransferase
MSVNALHFAPDPVAAGRELLRVTRPGSMLVATLWKAPRGPGRLTRDHARDLAAVGWSIEAIEDHSEWLEAQPRDREGLARDVAGFLGGEEQHGGTDVAVLDPGHGQGIYWPHGDSGRRWPRPLI